MRASSFRPSARRLASLGAALTVSLGSAVALAGCGGPATPAGAEGGTLVAASAPAEGATRAGTSAASTSATGAAPTAAASGPTDAATVDGAPAAGGAASRAATGQSPDPQAGSTPPASGAVAPAGSPAPSAVPPHRPIGGALEGLDCRARLHSAVGRSLFSHQIAGTAARLVEQEGTLGFEPVRLGYGGGAGDIASGLESFVATDAQGRLHYLEVEILRENTDGPVVTNVATDVVLVEGLTGAKAVAAAIVGHAYGDPEVFVVDAGGRLLRYTVAARGSALSASKPAVLATGLTNVTALGADVFDLDGDLSQERAAATRLVLVDGDVVRQMIVHRDGSHDAPTAVFGPQSALTGASAVTRMWCARPSGLMADQGALVVVDGAGAGLVLAGTYTPAVREPRLTETATVDAVPGLLAG